MLQKTAILKHLKENGPITPLEALRLYGCFRLAAQIHELRREGYAIKTTMVTRKRENGTAVTFAEYRLEETT